MTFRSEKALGILYYEYLRRVEYGTSLQEAAKFTKPRILAIDAFSSWNPSDVSYCLLEIKSHKFISIDIFGSVVLLKEGIEYMEKKPIEFFKQLFPAVKEAITLILAYRNP